MDSNSPQHNSIYKFDELILKIDVPISKAEEDFIAHQFSSPEIKKYLATFMWNQITDAANIPLPVLVESEHEYALKQAFVKGGLSVLHTLLSISKTKPNK